MIYTEKTKLALKLAFENHKDQVDIGKTPYIFHVYEVASKMETEDEICAALLHDIIEDTPITLNILKELGFNDEVLTVLSLLTKKDEVSYDDYIKSIKENKTATKIKIADLKHNSDVTRLKKTNENSMKRLDKYKKSVAFLERK